MLLSRLYRRQEAREAAASRSKSPALAPDDIDELSVQSHHNDAKAPYPQLLALRCDDVQGAGSSSNDESKQGDVVTIAFSRGERGAEEGGKDKQRGQRGSICDRSS